VGNIGCSIQPSSLTIINPREYNKKKFRKNMRFLRDTKNPSWLYLYYSTSIQGVDEMLV